SRSARALEPLSDVDRRSGAARRAARHGRGGAGGGALALELAGERSGGRQAQHHRAGARAGMGRPHRTHLPRDRAGPAPERRPGDRLPGRGWHDPDDLEQPQIPRDPRKMSTTSAVEISGVVKRYGRTVALDGVSFDVRPNELFALLGPNGAGKTTLLHILC